MNELKLQRDPVFLAKIEGALEQLRPYLLADGGNVSLLEVSDEMIVKLKLHGACSNCSMSMMTLKAGIEQSILRAVPEIKGVESVSDEAYEEMQMRKLGEEK